MTLDETLYALLFRRSFRERFVKGEHAIAGLDAVDEEALAELDLEELECSAMLACRAVLQRSQRGVGSLLDAFPRTVEAWYAAHPGSELDDLAAAFAESSPFEEWRPAGGGAEAAPPLEEVFTRFCEQTIGSDGVATARSECAFAVLRSLVVNPHPAFAIPSEIRRAPKGFYTVLDREGAPFLVAALERGFVAGAITPVLCALLRGEDPRPANAKSGAIEAARAELRALGLLA